MAAVTLNDILGDLNFLLGDSSIPSSGTDNQIRFVQRAIEKLWDLEDFEWAKAPVATATMSGQTYALSGLTNCDGRLIDVRQVLSGDGNDHVYSPTKIELLTDTDSGKYFYSVYGNKVDGFTLKINQTSNPVLSITYRYAPDILVSLTDSTRVPRSMPVAQGAFAWMQRTRNPFGTLEEFDADFREAVSDLLRTNARQRPARQFFTPLETGNKPIGQPR